MTVLLTGTSPRPECQLNFTSRSDDGTEINIEYVGIFSKLFIACNCRTKPIVTIIDDSIIPNKIQSNNRMFQY